ncbi:cell division protein FtsQ/DivIB [Sulfuriroseicoccus oceanibius]|uniref:FtsQ-type POTRA domain-containing protein n=1 Tax=Sulfuriroseicoccus oceanibius TaxID=2707525 RepID=A0A7T7F3D1_9BACT|nr:FtsQ-type POTRA domain-containing protein [Sulfuriroseicoccus oceanibius]QQL46071.1 FtsQ-type POTRA domain-containing protein [Sulfuriroseicoccus oceanibius]
MARSLFKGGLILLALLLSVVMVKHAFHRMLFRNDHFALRHVEFSTNGKTGRAKVMEKLEENGRIENLLMLDLAEMERTLETELPTVADARISRELPGTLVIELKERQPVAWLSCPQLGIRPRSSTCGQLVDAEGYAVACDRLRVEYMSFPVIEVADIPAVVTGRPIDSPLLLSALEALSEGGEQLMPQRTSITEIRAVNDYSLLVVLESGEEAIISVDDVETDMERFAYAFAELSRGADDGRSWRVNLLAQHNVPVQFFERKSGYSGVRRGRSSSLQQRESRPPRPRVVDPAELEKRFGPGVSTQVPAGSRPSVENDLRAILNRG